MTMTSLPVYTIAAQEAPETTVELTPPLLVSPANNVFTTGRTDPPLAMPRLAWQGVEGATDYGVEISSSAGFSTLEINLTTKATAYQIERSLANGDYYWRVRARERFTWGPYSEVRVFTKDWSDGGQLVPELLSPVEGETRRVFTNEDFRWSAIAGAATYLLEISTDPSFGTIAYSATTVKAHHTPTKRLNNNRYYWRVTPIDYRDNRGTPSAVHSFDFAWNTAPRLLGPESDVDLPYVPRFQWTAVEAAATYRLEVSTQPDFGSATVYVTPNTEYTPHEALSNDQDYYWRVLATDNQGVNTPWSEVRRFRAKWNFQAELLTPVNNVIDQSHPFFSWTSIPGAERYQVQVDESTSFERPLMNEIFYNVTTASLVRLTETTVFIGSDYFWRVRGIDARGNYTPWSNIHSFRFGTSTIANPIYPLYYYPPDTANQPVYADHSIAWPLFVWDNAHRYADPASQSTLAGFYTLEVSPRSDFTEIAFQAQTAGLGAAPTRANPFNVVDGTTYYWRVRSTLDAPGVYHSWITRIDRSMPQLPLTDGIALPIYPAAGFEAVRVPPVLGWQPVRNANHYRLQLSRDAAFTKIVEEVEPLFVNYVPGQGEITALPFGTYWWRVRAEDSGNTPLADWSEPRHFNLSVEAVNSNPNDLVPPKYPKTLLDAEGSYSPALTAVATSPDTSQGQADVGALHVMLNRVNLCIGFTDPEHPCVKTYPKSFDNYRWVIAFGTNSTGSARYGIYIDSDHQTGSGAGIDPITKQPIAVDPLYQPEYAIYLTRTGNSLGAEIDYYSWNGTGWSPKQNLVALGSEVWYASGTNAVQLLIPYTAIGTGTENFSGSLAMTVFSMNDQGTILDSVPPLQEGAIKNPAFVSDMVMPLYPFDTPLSNPMIHYDMPPLRWRLPAYDSNDGYEVEVARDARFTDVVETWEISEQQTSSFYSFLTTVFQSKNAYEDNESYYWRVRPRHERYTTTATQFDYGPWSPAMRFKLDSRQVGNPTLSTGNLAETTPSFSWDRVEGASGYTIQVAKDANFSSLVINQAIDGTSYTPNKALEDGAYFWRVAVRRSRTIVGHWTAPMPFTKQSVAPAPSSPIGGVVINEQPTFQWTAILTPTATPRVAAPRYQLQIDDDPTFGSPKSYTTESTAYTLRERESLADGDWYWRVAMFIDNRNVGAYSPVQQFKKEYLPPTLIGPEQNSPVTSNMIFSWQPLPGAGYYEIEIAGDADFNRPIKGSTSSTQFTPTAALEFDQVYWRVRMIDNDRNPGPFILGLIGGPGGAGGEFQVYLPLVNR